MTKHTDFLAMHQRGNPLVMPNPFDIGSALILESLGARALATSSSGFAATLGRADYSVTRREALEHAAAIAAAVDVPVSADLEWGFADDPAGVAETVALAKASGLAGCSVEDSRGDHAYDNGLAVERIAAAVEAAGDTFVITARSEALMHGGTLDDAISRLQHFATAGADVLFAPGVAEPSDIRRLVESVPGPVSVIGALDSTSVDRLGALGVARISTATGISRAAYAAVRAAGQALLGVSTPTPHSSARGGQ
jgi:2-methylisocitrate lyase-like PEP mutase family enzyme